MTDRQAHVVGGERVGDVDDDLAVERAGRAQRGDGLVVGRGDDDHVVAGGAAGGGDGGGARDRGGDGLRLVQRGGGDAHGVAGRVNCWARAEPMLPAPRMRMFMAWFLGVDARDWALGPLY